MSQQLTNLFIEALHALEETKDAASLTALYASSAAVGNVLAPDGFHGPEGAGKFWTEYRGTFEQIHSEFRNVIVAADRAALEWASRGISPQGKSVEYAGVTVLEMEGEKITRSCAYFDPAGLGHQIAD